MKEVSPIKKSEETQPKNVLTMCQFEKESMETKVFFALMAREVEEFKEQDKEYPTNIRKILDDFLTCGLQSYLINFLLCVTYNMPLI